jgi:hypothetical protein
VKNNMPNIDLYIGIGAGLATALASTFIATRQSERQQLQKELRQMLNAVMTCRHRLVKAMMKMAHATHGRKDLLDMCYELHDDLRLAAQTHCLLRDEECLLDEVRRFKTAVLDQVKEGHLTSAGGVAGRTMEVAADFNRAYDVAAAKAGLKPVSKSYRGAQRHFPSKEDAQPADA